MKEQQTLMYIFISDFYYYFIGETYCTTTIIFSYKFLNYYLKSIIKVHMEYKKSLEGRRDGLAYPQLFYYNSEQFLR